MTTIIDTNQEILEIYAKTGEILLSQDKQEYQQIQQIKIKAYNLLNRDDFVLINGTWEAKRDGLLKILTSLPISYHWKISENHLTDTYAKVVGCLTVEHGKMSRSADSVGICEMSELRGNKTNHIMIATAETRALKRAIETLFGSVINYYVRRCLVA